MLPPRGGEQNNINPKNRTDIFWGSPSAYAKALVIVLTTYRSMQPAHLTFPFNEPNVTAKNNLKVDETIERQVL
ncbi:MAG: hypothetical protein DRR19_14835 [Candidatus Parabeggiatoa sp. nov. 1]|nr:MAG: hypothetical protein DRR19_14835 [Gammaproteobacteria bacterium]